MDVLSTISTRKTAQTVKADPRQVKNAAGGYTFAVDDWARVHRFLTIGTNGGTYYTSAKDLTRDSADVILRAAATDPVELVKAIVDVSTRGKAPKQNPALFALAIAASCDIEAGRKAALDALPAVARTGTHLFLFAGYVEQFRGWGRGLRTAVGKWYSDRPVDKLAYQVLKYRQREGWTHRDLLRLSHPTGSTAHSALYAYVCGNETSDPDTPWLPDLVHSFNRAQSATTLAGWLGALDDRNLSWEMLPDAALGHKEVWEKLIHNGMPQTALMRQLPRLTRLDVLRGDVGSLVASQLQDPERLLKARVHPVNVLVALRTYAAGTSARGTGTWTPSSKIVNALDAAFYAAYGAIDPAGKRTLLGLDVSGSMTSSAGGLPISCREVSAAMAMVTAAVEPEIGIVGFTGSRGGYGRIANTSLTELDISPRRRLDDNIRAVSNLPFGRTDCALPMVWAAQSKVEVDVFTIYTDNETYWGGIHPHQALVAYRQKMGIDAKLSVVSLTATTNSIADPSDRGMIDVSGFDSSVPTLLSDFARGDL